MLSILAASLALSHASPAAQDPDLAGSFRDCILVAQGMQAVGGFGFPAGLSIVGARVEPGQSITVKRELEGGRRYAFLASFDTGDADVDVTVRGPNGATLAEAKGPDLVAAAVFRAPSKGVYELTISFSGQEPNYVGGFILVENGSRLPARNVITALLDMHDTARQMELPGFFPRPPAGLCLYGGVLIAGEALTIGPATFPADTLLVGACDENSSDIDLFLRDEKGAIYGADDADDDYPVVEIDSETRDAFVDLRNADRKETVALFGLFRAAN